MHIGEHVITTDAWAEAFLHDGEPLRGTLVDVLPTGHNPAAPRRTHKVRLSEPFLGLYDIVTFDPRDLRVDADVEPDHGRVSGCPAENEEVPHRAHGWWENDVPGRAQCPGYPAERTLIDGGEDAPDVNRAE